MTQRRTIAHNESGWFCIIPYCFSESVSPHHTWNEGPTQYLSQEAEALFCTQTLRGLSSEEAHTKDFMSPLNVFREKPT